MILATQTPSQPERDRSIAQIGLWSAILTTLFAVAFTLAFVVQAIDSPPSNRWEGIEAYAASFSALRMAFVLVPSLLLAPSFVALIAALHGSAPAEKRTWSRVGLAFAIIYAVIATFNYTVQLIVVRGNLLAKESAGLALLVMENPRSLFWALALIGYNFYMALAALLVIPTLGRDRLDRWISWLFAANAVASLVAAVNFFVTLDTYHILGLVASGVWCLGFPTASLLLAIRFGRMTR